MTNYIEEWKKELQRFSPKVWGFASFILPLLLIPAAIKGATMVAKEVKKAIDKNKK